MIIEGWLYCRILLNICDYCKYLVGTGKFRICQRFFSYCFSSRAIVEKGRFAYSCRGMHFVPNSVFQKSEQVICFIKMSLVCEEWYVEARGWNLDYSSFSPKCITKFIKGFFRKKGLQIALFYYSSHPNCSIIPNVPNKHTICLIGVKLLNHIWWKL